VCTVSVIPAEHGFRLICNRDEQRSRPVALPPRTHAVGRREAVFAVDPGSAGTWLGANDAGLVLALLNRSRDGAPGMQTVRPPSRGSIVPLLLAHDHLWSAAAATHALALSQFEPFQLIALQGATAAVLTSDGRRLTSAFLNVVEPILWTSSSLGDAVVERPRSALFDHLVRSAQPGDWPRAQRRFHHHRWRRHPELSVVMSRPDARTVSRTIVDVSKESIRMRYHPLDESHLVVERRVEGAA
jgi:hypothetical protein